MTRFPAMLLLAAVLAACAGEPEPAPPPEPKIAAAGHCEQRRFEGSAFTACRYDARAHELALIVDDGAETLRSFDRLAAQLGERRERLLFAMNAGMYDDDGRPIGLYVENGRERHRINLNDGPGNFHMKPNGVFAVAAGGTVAIVPSDRWAAQRRRAQWATQSGPLLVIGGALHPRIQANGQSRQIRNGVGVADAGTAWFAISDEPVSFGRFARFFRDALGCRDALFFDGAVSSLWDPAAGRQDPRDGLGPFVAVFAR